MTLPRVIKNDRQNKAAIERLEKLTSLETATPAQRWHIHRLIRLIEAYEAAKYDLVSKPLR